MKVIFTQIAKRELEDSVRYYEFEYSGRGKKFKNEVRKAIKRIVDYPRAWSVERGEVRKCLLYKFPYKLLYSRPRQPCQVIVEFATEQQPDNVKLDTLGHHFSVGLIELKRNRTRNGLCPISLHSIRPTNCPIIKALFKYIYDVCIL